MQRTRIMLSTLGLTAMMTVGGAAVAQTAAPVPDPGHPRINEVQQRIDNQQARVDRGVSSGRINARQAARDDAKLAREQNSLNRDAAANGGHITKAQQRNLNRRLNHGSRKISNQGH